MEAGLLDDDTFAERLDDLAADVEEVKVFNDSISNVANTLRNDQTLENYQQFLEIKGNLELKVRSLRQISQELESSSKGDDSRLKRIEKIQTIARRLL